MFEYVSGANFFGESLEWVGYAIACWSVPAAVFAIFTCSMVGTRALAHHKFVIIHIYLLLDVCYRFYLQKFEDYPKSRKAYIPYLL